MKSKLSAISSLLCLSLVCLVRSGQADLAPLPVPVPDTGIPILDIIIVAVLIIAAALVIFLILRNRKKNQKK